MRPRAQLAALLGPLSRRPAWRRSAVVAAALAALGVACWGLDRAFPFPYARLRQPPARIVRAQDGTPLRIFLAPDDRYRLPVRIDEVAPVFVRTLLASEDRFFRWHPGVNPLAIARATLANLRAGEVVSGASTLTTQVVRLAEPRPRTLGSKVIEALRALQLEWHYSKDELFEHYLNMTPYGGNVEGIGAASWFWFGKRPAQLSLGEAAMLTALPRSPVAYDPSRHPVAARAARDRVLRQLHERGVIEARELDDALRHELPTRPQVPPFLAPHFARWMLENSGGVAEVTSTLDLRVQHIAEQRLRLRVPELRAQGLGNAAVVVIENDGRDLRAMVGSADFFEEAFQGQVNGALARRSPGSTLKPYLYAQAIDRGLLVPATLLLDVPTDFSGYVAENYDGEYRGQVTAADALRLSLNAPAVRLLARVGLDRFHALLLRGGLTTLDRPPIHYGLPLVLGAGEVRLLDLVNLYATLAQGGVYRPVRTHPGAADVPATRLLGAEAAQLVTGILAEVERPDLPEAWRLTRDVPAVAWKTGTSYGHRDAWAVGFSRRYSIGVWVGNLDGRAQKGISGARHAGPMLFDLFRAIEPEGARLPEPRGLEIASTPVCADSHQLAGPFCPRTVRVETVSGRTRLEPCQVHRQVLVDAETGERLLGDCVAARPSRARVLRQQPAELVAWRRAQGEQVESWPPLSAACTGIPGSEAPVIVSPDAATPYLLRSEAPAAHQRIVLTARAGAETRRLFWYQDGELVAAAAPDERVFVAPVAGEHELVVVDDEGRADSLRYRVQAGGVTAR